MTDNTQYFNCYSRKLMYYLGLYGINYVDKFYNESNGRPYWQFTNDENLKQRLNAWNEFRKTL